MVELDAPLLANEARVGATAERDYLNAGLNVIYVDGKPGRQLAAGEVVDLLDIADPVSYVGHGNMSDLDVAG
jgi:hypothetical protein